MNEADTCRTLITPKLRTAGWTDEQIREQVTFTHGRIVPAGGKVARKIQKRADYLLYYRADYKVAVIEAKDDTKRAVDGLPQAKEYAKTLGLQYAYATNGHEILEFNFKSGESSTNATAARPATRATGAPSSITSIPPSSLA